MQFKLWFLVLFFLLFLMIPQKDKRDTQASSEPVCTPCTKHRSGAWRVCPEGAGLCLLS